MMTKREIIYLDYAASTPVPGHICEAVAQCMATYQGNPSSVHSEGRMARMVLEASRREVAEILNARPSEIIFTSGGTEANNAILWGCYKDVGRKVFITSRMEHPSVLNALASLVKYEGVRLEFVQTDRLGHIDLDHLSKLLQNYKGAVVSLMHANNEIGNLIPVKDIADRCRRHAALFHSDTVQTIGKYSMDMDTHPFDFAVASAHKFHGPKGIGFMYVRGGKSIEAFIAGGRQERNLRAGTENLCGIVGMAKALAWVSESMEETQQHLRRLKQLLLSELKSGIPDVQFNGDAGGHSIPSIVSLTLPFKMNTGILLSRLDMEGICVSAGSACSSGSTKESHVLAALGVDPGKPSIRVSFGRFNTPAHVQKLVAAIRSFNI